MESIHDRVAHQTETKIDRLVVESRGWEAHLSRRRSAREEKKGSRKGQSHSHGLQDATSARFYGSWVKQTSGGGQPREKSRGPTGQRAGKRPGGVTQRKVPKKTNRRWPLQRGSGKGE